MSHKMNIAGFNPLDGQTADFDDELAGVFEDNELGGDIFGFMKWVEAYKKKKPPPATPEIAKAEIAAAMKKYGVKKSKGFFGDLFGVLKDPAGAVVKAVTGKSMPDPAGMLLKKLPKPLRTVLDPAAMLGGITRPRSGGIGLSAGHKVTAKDVLLDQVRREKKKKVAKQERVKKAAGCPCAKKKDSRGRPILFPPAIEANLKHILGQLKYAELQRLATSEHRGKMNETTFREKVIRLANVCANLPPNARNEVIRVVLSRG